MADRIQATPQSPGLGALARALRGAQQFAERPFGYPNPPVALLSELIGLPAVQRTVERMSYGEPLTTGRGMTLRPREDTTEAALAVLPMAPGVVRGGLGAVKRATDLNAIRDYVRAAQGLSGLPGTAVVKPKGGNWISGAGSPEEAVRGLKTHQNPQQELEYIRAELERPQRGEVYQQLSARLPQAERETALNSWIDQKLAKYIRNEMGTPEDPLRALIQERGVSHLPLETLQEGAEWLPEAVEKARRAGGYPEEGMALQRHAAAGYPEGLPEEYTRAAQGWEAATDAPLGTTLAGELLSPDTVGADVLGSRRDIADMYLRENPWLAKVPPETPVYSIEGITQADLGFGHLVDELRNATRAGSDLPRELQLRPEQLSKVSMPQAVELVDRINKWRAAQAEAAQRAAREGIPVQKEYPEGFRWLAAPDTAADPRSLKYVQDVGCEGGWCTQGEATAKYYGSEGKRLYVLHDPEGRAVVQVAVKPSREPTITYSEARARAAEEGIAKNDEELMARTDEIIRNTLGPPEIVEIKGKGNRAPKDEYLPYVQDFVKSQRWGRIGDAQNTGMRQTREVFNFNELQKLKQMGEEYIPDVLTGEDIQRLHNMIVPEGRRLKYDARGNVVGSEEPGYARGGMVSAAGGGPAQYDPARISALADQLLMEA